MRRTLGSTRLGRLLLGTGLIVLLVGVSVASTGREALAAPETTPGGPTFVMRRAVNVSPGTMYVNFGSQGQILDPVYRMTGREDRPEDYPLVKSMGFDTVRYQFEPTPFTMLTGTRLQQAEAFIVGKLDLMLAAGLNVVVDLHPFDPQKLGFNASGDTSTAQFQAYVSVVQRFAGIANRYDPTRVALEIMNEPHWKACENDSAWSLYQPVLARAARAVAPRTTLVFTTGCWGGRKDLSKLDPSTINDSNSYYSVHMYEQVMFTHQGYRYAENFVKHVEGFPYPASAADYDGILARTSARIDADSGLSPETKARWKKEAATELGWYTKDLPLNRDRMSLYVSQINDWAVANRISPNRMFIGEFGVIQRVNDDPAGTAYPDPTSRTNWIRDLRELMEAKGFSWAVFNYAGRYGIVENLDMSPGVPRVIRPTMLAALGLNGPSTPPPATSPPATAPPQTAQPTPTATPPTTPTPPPTTRPTASGTTVIIRSTCNKDMVLDVRKLSMAPGGVVQIYWPNRTTNQQFTLVSIDGGNRYQIIARHSGLAIGADADGQGQPVVQRSITSSTSDAWEIIAVDGGAVEFRRPGSGLSLDVQNGSKVQGTPLQLWNADGSCAQRFRLEPVG